MGRGGRRWLLLAAATVALLALTPARGQAVGEGYEFHTVRGKGLPSTKGSRGPASRGPAWRFPACCSGVWDSLGKDLHGAPSIRALPPSDVGMRVCVGSTRG